MKRWRPLVWFLISLACFIGAFYFWRLGDRWQSQKTPATNTPASSNAAAPAAPVKLTSSTKQRESTAPYIPPLHPMTNGVVQHSTNLPYRLSNTIKPIGELMRSSKAILLENALIDSSQPLNLDIPDKLRAHGDPGSYIVQADGTIDNAFRDKLKAAGLSIVSYIPNNAFLVTGTAAQVASFGSSAIPFQPYYKVKTALIPLALAGYNASAVNVAVFPGTVDETKAALRKLGVTVGTQSPSPFGTELALQNVDVSAVASLPGIEIVEPSTPRTLFNDLTRVILGVSADTYTPTNYMNLNGANVTVAVNDSFVPIPGIGFTPSTTINPDLPNIIVSPDVFPANYGIWDVVGHGTHVAGIIAANGNHSPTNAVGSPPNDNDRGKATNATIFAMPLNELSDAQLQEIDATNALISNNSWGYGDTTYDLAAASYDQAVRDSIPGMTGSQSLIYVFAAGNDGGGDSTLGLGGGADTLSSPGVAKNVITVGASELPRNITNQTFVCDTCEPTNGCETNQPWLGDTSSSNLVAGFSSRGNVGINVEGTFGRFKPDVVAPGTMVVSTRSQTWDKDAYDNPVVHNPVEFDGNVVQTNSMFQFPNFFIPCSATQFVVSAVSVGPPNVPMPIYVSTVDNPPVIPGDLAGINQANFPTTPPLTPVDTFWFVGVGNPTNQPVTFNFFADVVTTNELGNYFDVLQSQLNDELLDTNGNGPFYRYESGTSMAAPAVSGVLALMEDYFTNTLKYTPSPALMKAMLINGARSINSEYDFQVQNSINYQGWGLVNLSNSVPTNLTLNAFNNASQMLILDQSTTNALKTGDSQTFFVNVNSNAQPGNLRVTLVWTDPPGNPAASLKLVNNLELIVTNLDSNTPTNPVVYFGNDFPAGSIFTELWDGDSNNIPYDTINNVQNVYIEFPIATNYSITVFAKDVNVNAVTANSNSIVQDYALVISSDFTNGLTLTNAPILPSYMPDVDILTNQFTDSATAAGAFLENQLVGASSPLQGTNTLGLTNQDNWATNGQITIGVTNQWHFYVITNTPGPNATVSFFTNALFATFNPVELSIPPVGVNAPNVNDATRPEADIDLYVARSSVFGLLPALNLTNLDPTILANCDKSLGRGGTEDLIYTNAQQDEVFVIGVKSEDQEAAEYQFVSLFTLQPFNDGQNNFEFLPVPQAIPSGTPTKAGVARLFTVVDGSFNIQRAVVTNHMEHQNFGDLVGTLKGPNGVSVVLNNHTFGNGSTNQTLIYEDNGQGDITGSRQSDGPGTLRDFIGRSAAGLWMLTESNTSLFLTGQVDSVTMHLDPENLASGEGGSNFVTFTILPFTFHYESIVVPPDATNLTICVAYDPASPAFLPLDLFVRYGNDPAVDLPTQTTFDYMRVIDPPDGGCLSISQTSLPPLKPGTYFIGVYNPNPAKQIVRLSAEIDRNVSGANPGVIVSTNVPGPLTEDAVTNNSIFITNKQDIVSVNVGVVLTDPRISDLDLTLVSPTGQRILLMENRGGPNTTKLGHLNVITNFFGPTTNGGPNANTNAILVTPNQAGLLVIDYNMYTIPDQMDVYYGGIDIFHSGYVAGSNTFTIPYGPGPANTIFIVMNQGNNPAGTTAWTYQPRLVTQDFTYFTFTDNTNLTDIPIKFAIPPFDDQDNGTNFPLSDFDRNTNGDYIATNNAPPIIIPDANGSWTLTTNDVFVRTNYFTGTNLINLATNQVSIVTDPFTSAGGSNYLALANGSISRVINNLTPQRNYTISYLYRGPGIAGWWRGEGDANDSSDPELLANNGGLIGRFNFPAGEVGQAFAMEDSGTAFEFAGTNTYVQIPQSPSLNVGANGSGFTVEGWINPTNTTFQQPLVEWLAHVPTNTIVNGQAVTNLVIKAGPFLNRLNGHYYYLLGQTNWTTSELWAQSLGGHLVEVDDANEEQFIYDTFATFGLSNYTMWIGLTNGVAPNTNFVWSTGNTSLPYTHWGLNEPTNCGGPGYVAILGPTNALPGLWSVLGNNGVDCAGTKNAPFGVVEVDQIQTNGVQLWISVTNSVTNTDLTGTGRLYANLMDTNNVSHEIFTAPGLIQSNVFQHIALTYNTNTGVAQFFYNGSNVLTTNIGVFVPNTGGDVLLGKDMSRVTNNFYWGLMDEMSIYSRYLSDSEIASIYNISAFTTNRNIGKFDPGITPALSLAEVQAVFGQQTNLIYGVNQAWQAQGFSFRAQSNTLPVQITGLQPGVLLDSFFVSEEPPGNLYYLPEQALNALVGSNAFGNWTLEIRDSRTGQIDTTAQLVSWELQFILQTNTPIPIQVAPEAPATNTIPPGQVGYFVVNVPGWALDATNVLVSSTDPLGGGPAPVSMVFNQNNPPLTGALNDFPLLLNQSSGIGVPVLQANPPSLPPLLPGQSYYLAITNPGPTSATVAIEVDYNITALTNGVPFLDSFNTNDIERPYRFNVDSNATEATFQVLQMSGGNADLVLRKGLPIPSLTSADYGSFGGSNANESIYVLTNSAPVQLSQGTWYMDVVKRVSASDAGGVTGEAMRYAVLAKELTNAPNIIEISNRVPFTFTAGAGAALTNFFHFATNNFGGVVSSNITGIHFELYNQNGNGDLTLQTNTPPLAPPFFLSSQLPREDAELIVIRSNTAPANGFAVTNVIQDYYLGVPNNETNPIKYTIVGIIDTNVFASFPTAEGAGSTTRGGANGTNVYHVTSLADSGAGTLRAAVTSTNGGGTVVFDVAGTITLATPLFITNSGFTIAGQTAPGGNGITVTGAPTYVQDASDIIIRYLRFRPTGSSLSFNGSFENPGGYPGATFSAPYNYGGWNVISGSIDAQLDTGWQAADGHTSLDMNGTTPGTISRTVPTVAGTHYNLRFAYSGNPGGGVNPKTMQVFWNGSLLGNISADITGVTFTNMLWKYTNFPVVALGGDTLEFASTTTTGATQFGPTLDAVSLTSGVTGPALQVTNSANIIIDHVSAGLASDDQISVLNSSNVTVQWSVLADSQNQADPLEGGSEVRYGSGDVTLHHNLYADNYSGNPTLGEDVTLDFINNVIYNWGVFAGLSTNDIVDNPGGITNFLNYSANYLIAGTNSDLTNGAFFGSSPFTFIFQTNNFIDTNLNKVLDGSDTSWGMFSNQFTQFSAPFPIQSTAPDEAFIAYERVLDFAGTSMDKRDTMDLAQVEQVRLFGGSNAPAPAFLSGMVSWWKAESNALDSIGGNNGTLINGATFEPGKVNTAFSLNGSSSYVLVQSQNPSLNIGSGTGMTIEGWINPTAVNRQQLLSEWERILGSGSGFDVGVNFAIQPDSTLYINISDTGSNPHILDSAPSLLTPNAWQHVAVTYDTNSGTGVLYINGAVVESKNLGSFTPQTSFTNFLIGARTYLASEAAPINVFGGGMDEWTIYKRALSECEIQAIYNSGSAGKTPLLSGGSGGLTNSSVAFADFDKDGIPDFWEITLGENATNFSANADRDGDGYTDLEEYLNWLGSPHTLTLTNTTTNVDLYIMSGGTGNLTFGVANGTNGTVYLTNGPACSEDPATSEFIAVFTPTNTLPFGTNGGFASFTYTVTNMDTTAYIPPVTVSVFVSSVPITNASAFSFPNPPNFEMNPNTNLMVTNTAVPTNGVTYQPVNPPPFETIDTNTGIITFFPTNGPSTNIITTVATDTNVPPDSLTNTFILIVNGPPVFILQPPPNLTNTALGPITVTNAATDPDMPASDLTYQLISLPTPPSATIGINSGIITWTPTLADVGTSNYFETVVTDTNGLSATNFFFVIVAAPVAPFAFTQPAQAITSTAARLNGMATPNGIPSVAWFDWGTSTAYGNSTPAISVGSGNTVVYVANRVTGLIPNVPYHYRLTVSNSFAVTYGFDHVVDQANLVVWGANFLKQSQPPVGLNNNVTQIAGAYDHSLAVLNTQTAVAWGDNTFNQVNVPGGLANVLAVSGGQYSSMALKNGGTVAAWGANVFQNVTNVPASINGVIMIATAADAGVALNNAGNVLSWGANFSGVTNVPATLKASNIVEVASGDLHGLAIKNDGTVIAWGENNAGQASPPLGLSNVVQVSGGNFHSLALMSNGTVVAWGDDSAGQIEVPPGLSNVVEIAAGGFHSLALKSDGTIVGWGDDSAGQVSLPVGLTNVVAIAAGNLHSLALTPLQLVGGTNTIILTTTNGSPQTNTILSGQTIFYQVNVPGNADFSTNSLFAASGGILNMWFTTNTPPTITNTSDYELITNAASGSVTLSTSGTPHFVPTTTYYLGVQNTNAFPVGYGVEVDFHFTLGTAPSTNTVPVSIIHTNMNGTNGFLLIWYAPSNDLFEVQWGSNLPPAWNTFTNPNPVTFNPAWTNVNATNTEFQFFDDGSQTGGFGPWRFYQVILLNGTGSSAPTSLSGGAPQTNGIPAGQTAFYQITVPANAVSATNSMFSISGGNLNIWFSTNSPPTIGNANDSLLITNAGSGSATLTTNGTPRLIDGGTYYLGVQNTNSGSVIYSLAVNFGFTVTTNTPSTNTSPVSIIYTNMSGNNGFLLTWFAASNDLFEVQWSPVLPPTNWNTFASPNPVTYDVTNYSGNQTNTQFDFFDDGSQTGGFGITRFYQIILLNGTNSSSPSAIPLVNGVPLPYTTPAGQTSFFSFDITQTNAAVLFELYNLSSNALVNLNRGGILPMSSPYYATSSVAPSMSYQQIVLRTNITGLTNLNQISWFLGVPNTNSSPINYTIRAALQTNGMLISGLPIGTKVSQSGNTNVQLAWNPTVSGETYEVLTNANLAASNNWAPLATNVASGTSLTFTNSIPTAGLPSLFYWVVQVP